MKIKEILPNYSLDDDLDGVQAVKIYRAIVMSGKDNPQLSDYTACPECGSTLLHLVERRHQGSWIKGICLQCNDCKWQQIAEEWQDISPTEQELLLAKYGKPDIIIC